MGDLFFHVSDVRNNHGHSDVVRPQLASKGRGIGCNASLERAQPLAGGGFSLVTLERPSCDEAGQECCTETDYACEDDHGSFHPFGQTLMVISARQTQICR